MPAAALPTVQARTRPRRGVLEAAGDRLPSSIRDRLASLLDPAAIAKAMGPWVLLAAGFAMGFGMRRVLRRQGQAEEGQGKKGAGRRAKGAPPPAGKLKMVGIRGILDPIPVSPGAGSGCTPDAMSIHRSSCGLERGQHDGLPHAGRV